MRGIDVSAWQENINWQALQEDGCEFVIVKIGERQKLSETFCQQVNEAVAHEMKIGIYYYACAQSAEAAQAEAVWVDAQIKEYLNGENPELGIWYDVEDVSMEASDVTEICRGFIQAITDFGYTYAGIYSSYNWLTNGTIVVDQLPADTPYWVAQYNSQEDFSTEHPDKVVKMWQYTDHISDDLPYDGNLYYE